MCQPIFLVCQKWLFRCYTYTTKFFLEQIIDIVKEWEHFALWGERIFPWTTNLFHLCQCQLLDFPICLKTAAACMSSCTSTNDSSSQHCHQIEYQGNHVNKQRNRSHLCSNAWHFLNMKQTVWCVFSGSFGPRLLVWFSVALDFWEPLNWVLVSGV